MVDPADTLQVRSISADYWNGGETYHCDISQENIPQKLSSDLVALFQGVTIRNTLFPRQNTYTVEPDSVYISIQVGLAEGSMRVNLSTNSAYTSAQLGDTHCSIVDGQALYQKVYDRLSPLLVAHGSPGAPEGEPSPTPSQLPQTVPWEVPEQPSMSYEEYFEQEREYEFFEHLDSAWFYDQCDFEYRDGALYLVDSQKTGEALWKVWDTDNLEVKAVDPAWIYGIVDGKTLIRMDYKGNHQETLFVDDSGLISTMNRGISNPISVAYTYRYDGTPAPACIQNPLPLADRSGGRWGRGGPVPPVCARRTHRRGVPVHPEGAGTVSLPRLPGAGGHRALLPHFCAEPSVQCGSALVCWEPGVLPAV